MKILYYGIGCIFGIAFIYGMWNLTRYLNYTISYKDMVKGTVCEMVKPEYLKKQCNFGGGE